MNLLFICSGNKLRSPTAGKVFKDKGYSTLSAGTSGNAVRKVSIKDLKWSDAIFVMEEKHKQKLLAYFPRETKYKKIFVLNILDNYKLMEQALIEELNKKTAPIISNLIR